MNKSVVAGIVLVILVAAGGAGYYLTQNIDGMVKSLVEEIGTDTTKTQVRLASAEMNLREGSGTLQGLTVANPAGFSNESLFSMDSIQVAIDTGSLTDDVKVIRSISINGARVLTEQVGGGTNVQALLNGMDSTDDGDSAATGGQAEDTLLAVEKITFTNGTIKLRSDVFGERDLALPDFTLTNLGSRENGLTPDELGQEISNQLLRQVRDAVKDAISDLAQDAAKAKIKEKIGEATAEGLNKLKGLFNKD